MPADVISCLRSLLIATTLTAPAGGADGAEQGPACDPGTDYAVAIEAWKKVHRPDAAPVPDRPVQHPRLREQLLRMRERDRSVRDGPHPDWQAMRATDQANTEQLIAIVERHGWPTAGLVGEDGADAAWLIVQHAPDVAVMKRFLALIDRHSATGAIPRRHFAYLHDRVAMLEGRPQLFGTQFRCDHADGRVVPYPFQDPVNIDALREAVGLYPIDLYWCAMIQVLEAPCGPALAPPG